MELEIDDRLTVLERADELVARAVACQGVAIKTLRRFIDRLDDAVPNLVGDALLRKQVVLAIGDYYEQLASTSGDLMAMGVHGVIEKLGGRASPSASVE